jgi:transcriptional regulator with XRE-family HTH domain
MMQRFGEKLRTLRRQHGLSQHQLADHLGVSRSFINELESGRKLLSTIHLLKVADFFGVPVEHLMRDELDLDEDNL